MQRYLCPACGEKTEAGMARVVWCGSCAQPLTIVDLAPISVGIEREETEPESPITA